MQYKVTRLFHVGWSVGPGTSPGKIFPSLNLNMHMCSSTCTGQNNNHKWNMGPEPGFSEGGGLNKT